MKVALVTGGATGLFSYNNTWNQNTLSSAEKALAQEQYYLDIYKTMQNEYKNLLASGFPVRILP